MAHLFYEAYIQWQGTGDADTLAFTRSEREYRNFLLVEQPNGDFACTMVRQYFFSLFLNFQYEALSVSPDEKLSAPAAKGLKEAGYHLNHSRDWLLRFGRGTLESQMRTQAAIDSLWPYTEELFDLDAGMSVLVDLQLIPDPSACRERWYAEVGQLFKACGFRQNEEVYMQHGGLKDGVHTEHLGHLLTEMQYLPLSHRGARW
jgi:ring-1,2-phenylacetyl-CoA epoxidase subunit PaaC